MTTPGSETVCFTYLFFILLVLSLLLSKLMASNAIYYLQNRKELYIK
jgi:hypothetical protein